MELKTRQKVWVSIFVLFSVALIPLSVRMVTYGYSMSSGGNAMNLLEAGVDEATVRRDAVSEGKKGAFYFFFALPLPLYIIANLFVARILGLWIGSGALPFWRILALTCLLAASAQTAYFSTWERKPLINLLVGAFTLWLGVILICALMVAFGKAASWIYAKIMPQERPA